MPSSDPSASPRWLSRARAAAYVSLTEGGFTTKVKAGLLPPPNDHLGPRELRCDRLAIDAAMEGGPRAGRRGAEGLAAAILAEGVQRRLQRLTGQSG